MNAWRPVIPANQRHIYTDWHLAPAVKAGRLLLCSGVLGTDDGGSIPADARQQYHRVFANLQTLLDEAGVALADIVDITSFHLDLANQIMSFGEVKDQYLPEPYPAWTAVEVAGIGGGAHPGALVEMKVTAVLPD